MITASAHYQLINFDKWRDCDLLLQFEVIDVFVKKCFTLSKHVYGEFIGEYQSFIQFILIYTKFLSVVFINYTIHLVSTSSNISFKFYENDNFLLERKQENGW